MFLFPTILLTRCAEDNQILASCLLEYGFSVFQTPFIQYSPVTFDHQKALASLKTCAGVLVTSRSVFLQNPEFWDRYRSLLETIPLYCVGQKTAQIAQLYFSKIAVVCPSATELIDHLEKIIPAHHSLVFFSGQDYTVDFQTALSHVPLSVTQMIVYNAQKSDHFDISVVQAFQNKRIDLVVLYSKKTATTFEDVFLKMTGEKYVTFCQNIDIVCISQQIADSLVLPWKNRYVTTSCHLVPFLVHHFF